MCLKRVELSCPGRKQGLNVCVLGKGREGSKVTAMDGKDKATSGHGNVEQEVKMIEIRAKRMFVTITAINLPREYNKKVININVKCFPKGLMAYV